MKTAVIYARYSSDSQTEQSIEGQLRVCEEYAKSHDILILDTYIDRAMTGTNDNRPDFQRMIKDSAKKAFEFVLVYKLDRFSRDKFAATMYKHTLKQNGVKVLSAMENIPDTPEGIILESLLEGMNQYYSAELSQKVKRGMRETRLKGFYQGGGVPYGYKVDGRKIIIDEERAENVRFMYSEFSKGVYVKDIIKALTLNGKTYKGKPFAMNTVYNTLKNEKYLGVYKHGEEIVDNMYPQIVPEEIFYKVRSILAQNKHGKRSVEVRYLLKGKLRCGYCGQNLIGESGTGRNGERRYYYKCRGRKVNITPCEKTIIPKDLLENLVIDFTVKELSKPQNLQAAIKGILTLQESRTKVNTALNSLLKEKREIETAIDNTMKAIAQGVITKSTAQYLKQYEERQEELERLILIKQSKTVIKITEKEIKEFYEQALNLEPQMLINYLIKEVVLYNDHIEIHYNSPIKTSPDDDNKPMASVRRGFSFYSETVRFMNESIIITLLVI